MKAELKPGASFVNIKDDNNNVIAAIKWGTDGFTSDVVYGDVVNGVIYIYEHPDSYGNIYRANGNIDKLPRRGHASVTNLLTSDAVEPGTTPPPEPPPPPDTIYLKYTILVYSDGSMSINGIPYQ